MKFLLIYIVFFLFPIFSFGLDIIITDSSQEYSESDYYFYVHRTINHQSEFLESILGELKKGQIFQIELTEKDKNAFRELNNKVIQKISHFETPISYSISHNIFDIVNQKSKNYQLQSSRNTGYYKSLCPTGDQLSCIKKVLYRAFIYTSLRHELGDYIGNFPDRPFTRFDSEFVSFSYPNFWNILSVYKPVYDKETGSRTEGRIAADHANGYHGSYRFEVTVLSIDDTENIEKNKGYNYSKMLYGEKYVCFFSSDGYLSEPQNKQEFTKKRSDPMWLEHGYTKEQLNNMIISYTTSYREDIVNSAECK